MIIREYEYEIGRPWNCQERFIEMINYDDPWQEYKDRLMGVTPSDFSMVHQIVKDTLSEENKWEDALSFEFEILDRRFIHVAQDWTRQYNRKSIIVTVINVED